MPRPTKYSKCAGLAFNIGRQNASIIDAGVFNLARIPTMDDAHIPNVETLSYGAAFAAAQIPNLDASKVTTGTFNQARIPWTVVGSNIKPVATATYTLGDNDYRWNSIHLADKIWMAGSTILDSDRTLQNILNLWITGFLYVTDAIVITAAKVLQNVTADAGIITSGTFNLARIPTMDDAHIPNIETLSYGAAFADAQIPSLAASKITSGTLGVDRIPSLAASKITSGTLDEARIPHSFDNDITIGDFLSCTQLYILAAEVINADRDLINIVDLTLSGTITVGADCNLYRGAANVLQTDDSIKTGSLYLRGDCIERWSGDADADLTMSYWGYNAGTTRFRNLAIYNGKETLIGKFIGSTGQLQLPITGTTAGLLIGGDVAITRSAAKVIRITGDAGCYLTINANDPGLITPFPASTLANPAWALGTSSIYMGPSFLTTVATLAGLDCMDEIDDLALIKNLKKVKSNGKDHYPCSSFPLPIYVAPSEEAKAEGHCGGIDHGGVMSLLLGAVKQLNGKVEALERKTKGLTDDGI